MVQILNKMVHLQYPILEIWCCHKHINQLPPSRLTFDTKLLKMFPINLAPQLCTSHSRRENIAPNLVCLLQPIKCKHVILRFLAPFWHLFLFSNAFLKAQMWQKLRSTSPSTFVSTALHKSLLQAKYADYCMQILSVCSGQSNACIQNQDFGYTLAMFLLLKCFLQDSNQAKKLRNMSPSRFVSTDLLKSLLQAKYVEYCM